MNDEKKSIYPIGVYTDSDSVYLLYSNESTISTIMKAVSRDGFSFRATDEVIPGDEVSKAKGIGLLNALNNGERMAIVDGYKHDGKYVKYHGDRAIKISYSEDLAHWDAVEKPVVVDANPTEVQGAFATKNGILLLYFKKEIDGGKTRYRSYLTLFDRHNPQQPVWQAKDPIWNQDNHWPGRKIQPIGSVFFKDQIISYFYVDGEIIYGTIYSGFQFNQDSVSFTKKVKLAKHHANPLISPNGDNHWEAFNTFNPAAVHADGKVHILYRAQGFDYISHVGYASSTDGKSIDEKLPFPVYSPSHKFEKNKLKKANYDFMSGGGIGGCEDPRVTIIGDKLHMVYVAFDGWSEPRLALTSILLDDFLNKRWLWSKPVLISPPGLIDKSGCLLPEKIDGKYVIFHRVFPDILIDYVDDLNFDGKTRWITGQKKIKIRPDMWDSRKIGAGAPPLKTKDGWLLIYYGVDDRDASKYHIGAMLLDLKHPEKVLYRSDKPILEPSEDYENNGFKPGIAYPCGAVIIENELLVYYGGADSYVCVATADLDQFLEDLKQQKTPYLENIQVREVTI